MGIASASARFGEGFNNGLEEFYLDGHIEIAQRHSKGFSVHSLVAFCEHVKATPARPGFRWLIKCQNGGLVAMQINVETGEGVTSWNG